MNSKKEKFIEKAKLVHGNKYDYSEVEYVNTNTKVCIICPEHGKFWQTPGNHLQGRGCPVCAKLKTTKKLETFISEAKKLYGNKYDYSKVNYVNNKTKVCIISKEYGEFWITPNNFLRGHNCNGIHTEKLDTDIFIDRSKKVHGDKYDYSKVKYINSETKVCIICPEHGEFWQAPFNHLRGKGCPKCSPNCLKNNEDFISRARETHCNKYDYSKVEYNGNQKKVCIICPEHGEFWQAPIKHINGCGCPSCNNSMLENEIFKKLTKNKINFEIQKTFDWLKNGKGIQKLDFYLPDYNIAIECQGRQHFEINHFFDGIKGLLSCQYRDMEKYNKCEKNNILMLYFIPYDYEKYDNDFYSEKMCFKNSKKLIKFIKNYGKQSIFLQ